MEKKNKKKKLTNLCLCLSDTHFGHEGCIYDTYWSVIDNLIEDIEMLKLKYDFKNVFLISNGDVVSGTMIYRNQYLESQVQKNESILMFGAYLMHLTIEKIEKCLNQSIKVFIIAGNHEIGRSPLPHNFSIGIARRLSAYHHDVRYVSLYLVLNLAKDFELPKYNICAFHSWGGSDYSSASPSVIREMTRIHSQFATDRGIIIQRFLVGHTHYLEIGRSVLGIRFDVLGGFMKWNKTISIRESGMLYYIYDEEGDFQVRGISGMKEQIKEVEKQNLHTKNLKYVANIMDDAIQYEISLGLLQEPIEDEEI